MSLRSNGSYIGPRPDGPTNGFGGVASGIWDLRTAQRQRSAAAWPFPFGSPTHITGLQLWLDASDASTLYDATSGGSLVAADGSVARWEDKSGNARHATQGTSGSRPLRKASVQGGKDVLRFDGTNDWFSVPSSEGTFKFLHSADSTVFVVMERSATADSCVLDTAAGDTVTRGFSAYYEGSGGTFTSRTANGSALATSNTATSLVQAGWNIVTIRTRPTQGTASARSSMRRNGGSAVENNTLTATASTSNASYPLNIGRFEGVASGYAHGGDIAEIIIYDSALSDTDRESVENYLLAKWGI